MILAEAAALKKAAVDYAHPEIKVRTSDPSSCGRNYFSRFSALEVAHEDIEQKAQVLADVRALKTAAVDYAHPEVGVVASDPSVYGRNYFNRVSAPEVEDADIEERAKILAEAVALKKAAVDYAHPEIKVRTSDPSSYGRNYFSRFSAPEVDVEHIEESAAILAEASLLKTAAVDYAHPEVGVVASDPSVYGRNYYNRYSTDHPAVSLSQLCNILIHAKREQCPMFQRLLNLMMIFSITCVKSSEVWKISMLRKWIEGKVRKFSQRMRVDFHVPHLLSCFLG